MDYENNNILIDDIRNGKESAYVYLLEHYHKRLFSYALTLSNDQAMAQDIVQNVFLKTWEKKDKLIITTSLINYLFKSIYNEFINQYKKNRSHILIEQKYYQTLEKVITENDSNFTEKAMKLINDEIENLPPKCKQIFVLSRKEGLTNIEIADHLEISIKAVEAQITKAFSILRSKLKSKILNLLFLSFRWKKQVI